VMNVPGMPTDFVVVLGDQGRTFHIVVTSSRATSLPGNPDCTNGCDLALQSTQSGERIFSHR
jgi:hypothetical protein